MTAIPKKPVGSKGPRGPRIERIVAASGRGIGRARRAAEAGTTLRIIGGGFGRDSTSVQVLFDETPVRPFRQPFSTSELLVTTPLLAKRTTSLRVRAGRRTSNPIRFTLRRPLTHLVPPGEATHTLLAAVDQYAALSVALARTVGLGGHVGPSDVAQLANAAAAIDGMRKLAQRSFEIWM